MSESISWTDFVHELSETPPVAQILQGFLSYTPRQTRVLPAADRWVLTSNLHKAIRYGLAHQAAITSEALFQCDPTYFYRRLPVIALEDISLGNLPACLEILTFCRDLHLRRKFQGMGLARYLGERLAATHKSRSACDLISLVAAQLDEQALESEITGMSIRAAMDAASSPDTPLRTRAVALLRLDRLPIRNGDKRAKALRRVSEKMKLPAVVSDVLVSGNATHGLNALLPLIYELMAKRHLRIEQNDQVQAAEYLDGPILCSALDQYTRSGQESMKQWLRITPELSGFIARHGLHRSADKIVRMALFHIESSLLNSRITNDCLGILRQETERAEMAALGLNREDAFQLYAAMRRNLPTLNIIRRRLWKKN